jgi:hypothetical protein
MGDGTKIEWTDATWSPRRAAGRLLDGVEHNGMPG